MDNKILKARSICNKLINSRNYTDEQLHKALEMPRNLFNTTVIIFELEQVLDIVELCGDYEHYLQLSAIDKFTINILMVSLIEASLGIDTTNMLLMKIDNTI